MRLILVRHAETAWNEAGRYQGWEDPPLSERGVATAERIGTLLRNRCPKHCPVWSSDLRRAEQTACIALGRAPRLDLRLRELDFGVFAGRTHDENLAHFGARFADWVSRPGHVAPPDGESLEALLSRTGEWLDEVRRSAARADDVVAVTHGGVIRILLERLLGEERWPANGEVHVVRWSSEGVRPTLERWSLDAQTLDAPTLDAQTHHPPTHHHRGGDA
jgi:alpha-ribazole phosphatase